MKLSDTRFVVTGAARGMGAHFAQNLVQAGAKVAACDIAPIDESEWRERLGDEAFGRLHFQACDVANNAAVEEFVQWADDALGGVNGLLNNAGILRDGLLVKRSRKDGAIHKLPAADWDAVIAVNLTGATWMVREVVAKMAERGQKGVIVNMSSIARYGNRGQSNYSAAKAALAANTKTWSLEFAPFGIRVAAVAPGMIETPMTQGMNQKARDALVSAIPVGRIGTPEDIWCAVRFCVECEYFNGRTIDVDGGLSF